MRMFISYLSTIFFCLTVVSIPALNNAVLSATPGADPGGPRGPGPPRTTKNEAPAPKFYKTEAPEWQF